MIGTRVSRYQTLERLGSGGMGVVYKAQDQELGRFVALKFLPDELTRDTLALERFRREARAASALNHPNICTIYEIGEDDGRRFIAMEFLEGVTTPPGNSSLSRHRDRRRARRRAQPGNHPSRHQASRGETAHLTTTGTVMGTAAYMSPEQVRAQELDGQTDLFSFGAVLKQPLACMPPLTIWRTIRRGTHLFVGQGHCGQHF
jgi:eukaryotic-like serine/threonine-protein kinase